MKTGQIIVKACIIAVMVFHAASYAGLCPDCPGCQIEIGDPPNCDCQDDDNKCSGCKSCSGGSCSDDDSNCSGCKSCVSGSCVDRDSNCTGCESCVSGSCVDNNNKCMDCEDCDSGVCVNACLDPDVCVDNECETPCEDDDDCSAEDCEACDTETGYCRSTLDQAKCEECVLGVPQNKCHEELCEVCDGEGTCAPKPCPLDSVCVLGVCQPLDGGGPCDTSSDCPDDLFCLNGTCVPEGDDCDPTCDTGEHCVNGTCVEDGDECDPACDTGYVCLDGECVPDDECDPECEDDEVCANGVCVPVCDPGCSSANCENCDTSTAMCEGCAMGYICVAGDCLEGCTENSDCDSGEVCRNGVCVTGCTYDEDCGEDEVCVDGICQPEDGGGLCEDDDDCPEGQSCSSNGICQPDEGGGDCQTDDDCLDGQTCSPNGTCQPDDGGGDCQTDDDCLEDQTCVNGTCQPDDGGGDCTTSADCPPGQICIGGTCVPDDGGCKFPCDPEYHCVNGECVPDGGCSECTINADCATGEICVDGCCVPAGPCGECNEDTDCPSGEFCDDGCCEPESPGCGECTVNEDCTGGAICNNGCCVCPVTTMSVNEQCVPGDATPPTPNPMTWETAPYIYSNSSTSKSVKMVATTASDPSTPVKYYFEETSGNPGGNSSQWQEDVTFHDYMTAEGSGNTYTYKVKAKDDVGNQTAWSTSASVAFPTTPWVVVLDPGHGGTDPGAEGLNGILEKTLTLDLINRIKTKLGANADVYLTRTTDVYVSLSQRPQIANNNNADIFLSLHFNSVESSPPNGMEILGRVAGSSQRNATEDAAFANRILNAAHAAYLQYDSTLAKRTPIPKLGAWAVLSDQLLCDASETPPVSAILEINFLTNTTFDQKWNLDANKDALRNSVAEAIADAIIAELRN